MMLFSWTSFLSFAATTALFAQMSTAGILSARQTSHCKYLIKAIRQSNNNGAPQTTYLTTRTTAYNTTTTIGGQYIFSPSSTDALRIPCTTGTGGPMSVLLNPNSGMQLGAATLNPTDSDPSPPAYLVGVKSDTPNPTYGSPSADYESTLTEQSIDALQGREYGFEQVMWNVDADQTLTTAWSPWIPPGESGPSSSESLTAWLGDVGHDGTSIWVVTFSTDYPGTIPAQFGLYAWEVSLSFEDAS